MITAMALNPMQRRLVEMIRGAKHVSIVLNDGTRDEISIKMAGRAPHDIALAVQTIFNEQNKTESI